MGDSYLVKIGGCPVGTITTRGTIVANEYDGHGAYVVRFSTGEVATFRYGQALSVLTDQSPHDCWDNAVEYVSDGPLGHGWECGLCGAFLQAG